MTFNDPLSYYEEVRSAKMRKRMRYRREEEEDSPSEIASIPDSKRAITYQVNLFVQVTKDFIEISKM